MSPYQSILAILLCVLLFPIGAMAQTPETENAKALFLASYPDADHNGDGTLTPSEVWYFRTLSTKARDRAKIQAADRLMRETYRPSPISDQVYGPFSGKRIKLFVLSGQSNMVGQGLSAELSPELLAPDSQILMFEDGKWQPLRPLIHRFGPEIAFAHEMAKAWPDETIGIVKQATGETGILAWSPDWTFEQANRTNDGKKGNLWKELTDKVHDAREAGACDVMAFVWQQGGRDMSKLDVAKEYLGNLKSLMTGLRKETGEPNLPIILGSYRGQGIPDDLTGFDPIEAGVDLAGNRPGAWQVIKAQFDAQKEVAPAKMIPLRDLELHPKNIHYNTAGQLELGRLLARGFPELKEDLEIAAQGSN